MDSEKFSEVANQSRWLIIKYWLLLSKMTNSESARILVECAIKKQLVKPRKLSGDYLKKWCNNKKVPLWACLAALELSLENGWIPLIDDEWIVFSYLFIRLKMSDDLSILLKSLPDQISEKDALPWIQLALKNNFEYELVKKI